MLHLLWLLLSMHSNSWYSRGEANTLSSRHWHLLIWFKLGFRVQGCLAALLWLCSWCHAVLLLRPPLAWQRLSLAVVHQQYMVSISHAATDQRRRHECKPAWKLQMCRPVGINTRCNGQAEVLDDL
jgi:hypothetical protein